MLVLNLRDREILSALSLRVRMAHLHQIARTWWPSYETLDCCRSRLDQLIANQLIARCEATVIRMQPLASSLAKWRPTQQSPDLGKLAWTLSVRWQEPPIPTSVYFALPRLAQRYGGRRKGTIPRSFQISHDLAVTEMFLAIRRHRSELAHLWVDEDRLAPFRRGEKLPDAVIADYPGAPPRLVLEFGSGNYGADRLRAFHDDCEMRGLPYEIW